LIMGTAKQVRGGVQPSNRNKACRQDKKMTQALLEGGATIATPSATQMDWMVVENFGGLRVSGGERGRAKDCPRAGPPGGGGGTGGSEKQ